MIIIVYIILGLFGSIVTFLSFSPQFGKNPTKSQQQLYSTFDNYKDGAFVNIEEASMITGDMPRGEFFKDVPGRRPDKDFSPQKIDFKKFRKSNDKSIKFVWIGHSSFLFNIGGKLIMLDPMFGDYCAPIPIPTLKRFQDDIALSIEDIDSIDLVIFSHDHYDHLDYLTIKKIKNKVKKFYVPYGIGNHLKHWGVKDNLITEFNWFDSKKLNDIDIVCLPSRHFSGRGPKNRNSTLWASWAIISELGKIYFSGDGGYGSHFKDIGKKYGPFDLSLIDSGQYNKAWKHSHMFPKEAVMAAQDLGSKYYMPIHWGAFKLSTHHWTDPVEGAILYAKEYDQKIITPQLGEVVLLDKPNQDIFKWWNQ